MKILFIVAALATVIAIDAMALVAAYQMGADSTSNCHTVKSSMPTEPRKSLTRAVL
jgi:hypothetical protein